MLLTRTDRTLPTHIHNPKRQDTLDSRLIILGIYHAPACSVAGSLLAIRIELARRTQIHHRMRNNRRAGILNLLDIHPLHDHRHNAKRKTHKRQSRQHIATSTKQYTRTYGTSDSTNKLTPSCWTWSSIHSIPTVIPDLFQHPQRPYRHTGFKAVSTGWGVTRESKPKQPPESPSPLMGEDQSLSQCLTREQRVNKTTPSRHSRLGPVSIGQGTSMKHGNAVLHKQPCHLPTQHHTRLKLRTNTRNLMHTTQ